MASPRTYAGGAARSGPPERSHPTGEPANPAALLDPRPPGKGDSVGRRPPARRRTSIPAKRWAGTRKAKRVVASGGTVGDRSAEGPWHSGCAPSSERPARAPVAASIPEERSRRWQTEMTNPPAPQAVGTPTLPPRRGWGQHRVASVTSVSRAPGPGASAARSARTSGPAVQMMVRRGDGSATTRTPVRVRPAPRSATKAAPSIKGSRPAGRVQSRHCATVPPARREPALRDRH